MTDMTPGPVVEAATPGSGGAGVRESGEGSKTPVPPLARSMTVDSRVVDRNADLFAACCSHCGCRPGDRIGHDDTCSYGCNDALSAIFGEDTADALNRAGYDVIGYLDTTSLPLSALTGVQG